MAFSVTNNRVPPGLAVLLATMTAIGPFSIDTYLPAFPAMAQSLGASALEVQQTLSFYMAAFSFMMLWHGALADALGRRRVLLVAFAVFALASVVCAFATRIEYLWFGRALQGLSGGAGMVVSRAIVRDLLDGPPAQRLIAHIGMMFAVAPAIAPVLGGWIHAYFNWQAIFVFLAAYGALVFAAIYFLLPETLPPHARQSLQAKPLARAYGQVFTAPAFLALALAVAFHFNGFFVYVLSAPKFLIEHLGTTAQGFLWMFGPDMVAMIAGNYLNARLAGRLSSNRTIALGYAIMVASALGNILLNYLVPASLPWAIIPMAIYVFGMAITMPSLSLRILDLFPARRGLVSSCQGTLQTGINTISAALLAPLFWGSTLSLALAMAIFLLLSCGSLWFMRIVRPPSNARAG